MTPGKESGPLEPLLRTSIQVTTLAPLRLPRDHRWKCRVNSRAPGTSEVWSSLVVLFITVMITPICGVPAPLETLGKHYDIDSHQSHEAGGCYCLCFTDETRRLGEV